MGKLIIFEAVPVGVKSLGLRLQSSSDSATICKFSQEPSYKYNLVSALPPQLSMLSVPLYSGTRIYQLECIAELLLAPNPEVGPGLV